MTPSILFMSEPRAQLRQELKQLGFAILTREDEPARGVDLVLIEPTRLSASVAELRQRVEQSHPGVPVIVMEDAGIESAIAAMHAGAADYLESSASAVEIARAARRVVSERAIAVSLAGAAAPRALDPELVGNSPQLRALRSTIAELARSGAAVLISGEAGSGKTFVARLLHGQHNLAPLIHVDCVTLFASANHREQFARVLGEVVSATTHRARPPGGAHTASLCLRHVASLPLFAQLELLSVLSDRGAPSGNGSEFPGELRLLGTSSVPLDDLVRAGELHADLHRRLTVTEVVVPPLRDREFDVLMLAEVFLSDASRRLGKSVRSLSVAAAKALLSHGWPGNVRELEHAIEHAVTVTAFDHLSDGDLPEPLQNRRPSAELEPDDPRWSVVERQHIEAVLRSVAGNRARAARLLGIDRRTLHRKLDRLGIAVPARPHPAISK